MFYPNNHGKTQSFHFRNFIFPVILFACSINLCHAQQVTEVITDFNSFWKSTTASQNPTFPNTSHNVLSFKYNGVMYSTGVNNTRLTDSSITYTAGDFRAFPVATVGGTVTSGASIYIALASRYDGIPNGFSNPLPSLKIKDVLIDGVNGLDLGTGATNIPASALVNFPISTVISSSIADSKPDILVSQIASPTSTGDTLYFVNSSGVVVGNKVAINWNTINKLGTYYLDLYTLPNGSLCDTARISGTFDKETTREIRLAAYTLSDFGITTGNASSVAGFILKASGTSDPAFIAYNADAFIIPAPIITVQPVSQVVCPNVSNSVTFSVTATGGSLTYQWRKNNTDIPGATASTYTIASVISSSAGAYSVIVSNPVGSVSSNIAYLNTAIAVQPSPTVQTIVTGAACTLSVNATNATSYQWKKAGVNISGANSASYEINPVTASSAGDYTVQVINSTSGGCANIVSSIVTVVPSTTLYSKSSGNLNLPVTWGVATDGSGSSPVDFSRSEHTFVVKNNAVTGGNLTIAGTLDLGNAITSISANTTLDAQKIIRSGTGSLAGTSTSNLTVRDNSNIYFQAGNDMLKYFTIHGGNINLNSSLSITGGLVPGSVIIYGGRLNTNGNLTLKSTTTGTANIGSITGGGIINGDVTMERYIPASRGWRLLSAPVNAIGAPTINADWQEGLTTASANPNLYPGYGVKIAGGTTGNGFDQSITNSPFIKVYNQGSNTFTSLPTNPGTNIPISTYPAYFLYIRGDRSIDLMQGLGAGITSTTLRTKGKVNAGNQAMPVNASGYTLVGNPYPSSIDFSSLSKSNVKNAFYVWDPKLAGSNGLGGYVTFIWNSSTSTYDATASVSPVSQYIPSGEAFFVSSLDNSTSGTLTFKETDKTTDNNNQVFRNTATAEKLKVNLYLKNSSDSAILMDGVLATYDEYNSDGVDNDDAIKLNGSNESIGIKREGKMLSIERRKEITANDTLFLNLYQMRIQNYKLEVIAGNMNQPGMIAVIKDSYSNMINNMPLDLNGTTSIPFSINSDPASYAINRFSIVFTRQITLPLSITSVNAARKGKVVEVSWTTSGEKDVDHYEIERAIDGVHFNPINNTPAKGSNGEIKYKVVDNNPLDADNYYRVRSIERSGRIDYSSIVKVRTVISDQQPSVTVYPNPVTGNQVSLQFANVPNGNYIIHVFNTSGQLMMDKNIDYDGNSGIVNIEINAVLSPGKYEIKISGKQVALDFPLLKK